ncbi:MAG TPA: ATP-binding protein [Stellaceae bacterium]|nr:ATP-binding protein [Stellaceae bacterium]
MRTSVGRLIFIAFVAMGIITAALGGYGLIVLSAAGRVVTDTYDRSLMTVSYARSASLDFSRMETETLRRSVAPPGARAPIDARLDGLITNFDGDLGVVDERSLASDERDMIRRIRDLENQWVELRRADDVAIAKRNDLAEKIIEHLDMLIELTADHSFVARRKALTKMKLFTYSSFGAIAVALLLSGGITLLLTRRIMRPLASAAAVADRIATGELDTPIPRGGEDETGSLLRSMTVMQDSIRVMVEREKAQRLSAQTRLVDALESSREAIVLIGADDRVVIANSQLANFFPTITPQLARGVSLNEAFGQLGPLMTEFGEGAPENLPGRDLLSTGSEFRLADGRWLWVSRSATRDGGFFLLISDISDIKVREARLDEARRQAEAASQAKGSFLATISHELRTPLNAIIGFSEIIAAQLYGDVGHPKYAEYAESIHHSGTHLLSIINTVLDLTRHEAGKLELQIDDVDVVAVVDSALTIMRDQLARAELNLTTQLPGKLTILADRTKLRQIVLNLLSNAVKFTNPGGTVGISVEAVTDGRVRLRVSDTGIGMSADQIPVALAMFGQVDVRLERRYEGTGLGLPLAKSLAELHGGELSIESELGHGTTVTILLPPEPKGPFKMPSDSQATLEKVS